MKRKLIKDMAAKFAQKEILPVRDQFEADYEKGKLVDRILLEAAKIGLLGFPIQEKYGGSNGNNIDTMVVLARVSHRSSSRDGGESREYKARAGKWAQAYFHSTSRSFFKRNAIGMGLSAVTADYW